MAVERRGWLVVRSDSSGSGCCDDLRSPFMTGSMVENGGGFGDECCGGGEWMKSSLISIYQINQK